MQYNISVYTDGSVSDDLSTVYGSSNFVDNSTLCGATHSNYQSIVTIYAPGGSDVSQQDPGTESSTQIATNGTLGTYNVVGEASLYCSAAEEQIQSGGPQTPVQVTATLQLTVSQTSCTIARTSSTCQFVVGAQANGGWQGTVDGTISISDPALVPNTIFLSAGTSGANVPFTLGQNGSTQGACTPTPNSFCFTVTTDSGNTSSGTVTYSVTLNGGTNYTVASSAQTQQVKVTVQ